MQQERRTYVYYLEEEIEKFKIKEASEHKKRKQEEEKKGEGEWTDDVDELKK